MIRSPSRIPSNSIVPSRRSAIQLGSLLLIVMGPEFASSTSLVLGRTSATSGAMSGAVSNAVSGVVVMLSFEVVFVFAKALAELDWGCWISSRSAAR